MTPVMKKDLATKLLELRQNLEDKGEFHRLEKVILDEEESRELENLIPKLTGKPLTMNKKFPVHLYGMRLERS